MITESFLSIFVFAAAGSYILNALILERRMGHEGPLKSKSRVVIFPEIQYQFGENITVEAEHQQSVALWDWLRRLFGVYRIEGNKWYVDYDRAERWTCSFCLSFWTTIPLTLFYSYLTGLWIWFPITHLAIAVVSRALKKWAFE